MLGKLLRKLFGQSNTPRLPPIPEPSERPSHESVTAAVSPSPVFDQQTEVTYSEAARDALKEEIRFSELNTNNSDQLFYQYLLAGQHSDGISELERQVLLDINSLMDKPDSLMDRIPRLPQSVNKLLEMVESDNFDSKTFCDVVSRDPTIATQLISVANSAQYNPQGDDITDLKRSFSLLGSQGVKQHVLLSFVKSVSNISHAYFKAFGEKIWLHSEDTAQICRDLARLRGLDTDAAFLIGLLHDIGKIVIFRLIVDATRRSNPDDRLGSTVVKQLLSLKSMQLSALIVKHWKMPDVVATAIRDLAYAERQSAFSPLGRVLIDANFISEWRLILSTGLSSELAFERAAMRMKLADDVRSYIAATGKFKIHED